MADLVADGSIGVRSIPRRRIALHGRELAAATIGAVVESFDWSVYVVFAAFFAKDLFGSNSLASMIAAYGGFAIGFLARPLGSIIFGPISDRRGRRFNLLLCMSIISVASFAIALLPTAHRIGAWAAVAVVALRIVQGVAYGGEGPTVAAYVAETAPPRRRYLFSAVSYGGIMVGSLLVYGTVAVLTAILGDDALHHGAWRWGFAAGGLLGLLALGIRSFAPESGHFEHGKPAVTNTRPPLIRVFHDHPMAVLTIFLTSLGGTVSYYFALVYLPKYAANVHAAKTAAATSFMTVVLVVVLVVMLVVGALADRFGLLRVMRIGSAFSVISVLPASFGMAHGVIPFQVAALVLGVGAATFCALANVFGALLMPADVRALGAGVVSTATIAVFGGTFPMIAEALQSAHLGAGIPIYVFATALAMLAGSYTVTKVRLFTETMKKENADVHP
ncbi:MFS transporter [Nocardia sp. NEAU-G5]|uniref:MFS transporter n=1 Tax=Nocardia albiluteola TaxID=2842303 RepID=A0ABS6B2X2_9NOCA|nr:MFS transporter [Nocardia albiluteola]MBU3063584.1 MFS transporter [Nocardia albiluteola]